MVVANVATKRCKMCINLQMWFRPRCLQGVSMLRRHPQRMEQSLRNDLNGTVRWMVGLPVYRKTNSLKDQWQYPVSRCSRQIKIWVKGALTSGWIYSTVWFCRAPGPADAGSVLQGRRPARPLDQGAAGGPAVPAAVLRSEKRGHKPREQCSQRRPWRAERREKGNAFASGLCSG